MTTSFSIPVVIACELFNARKKGHIQMEQFIQDRIDSKKVDFFEQLNETKIEQDDKQPSH